MADATDLPLALEQRSSGGVARAEAIAQGARGAAGGGRVTGLGGYRAPRRTGRRAAGEAERPGLAAHSCSQSAPAPRLLARSCGGDEGERRRRIWGRQWRRGERKREGWYK